MRWLALVLVLCASTAGAQATVQTYEHTGAYWCTGTIHGAPFSGDAFIDWGRGTWRLTAVHGSAGTVCADSLKQRCTDGSECRSGRCVPDPVEFRQTVKGDIAWVSDTEFDAKTAYAGGAVLRFLRDTEDNITFQSSTVTVDFESCERTGGRKGYQSRAVPVRHVLPQRRPARPAPRARRPPSRFPRFGERR